MNRRKFLSVLPIGLVAAAPAVSASILALDESRRAVQVLDEIRLSKDLVTFSNCTFNMGGNVVLSGDYQSISYCNFSQITGPAIEVKR